MIVPDTNMLLYAYRDDVVQHDAASLWWADLMSGREHVGLPWSVIAGFVRIMTNPRSVAFPISTTVAFDAVNEWLELDHVMTINPGSRHMGIFRRNLEAAGVGGNLVPDAHIAAIAMEYQAEVHTNDRDFARFPGLRWRNPL
ncbi:MAG: type II toxin-antitoxin system VapC family toxin [Chloroflexi bacterium]|nr:type II toxin-antitoxin system VapC family toxin [Chloroflexota bacterium]